MGAYAYCQTKGCDCPLSAPSLEQVFDGEPWTCAAGHDNDTLNYANAASAIERRINEIIDARAPALLAAYERWLSALAENTEARMVKTRPRRYSAPFSSNLWEQPVGVLPAKDKHEP